MATVRTRIKNRRGVIVIEAAMVLLLLLLLSFAVFEYGWMFIKSGQINNMARHGARLAARAGATATEVRASVDSMMVKANIASYEINLSPDNVTPDTGEPVSVEIVVPYNGQLDLLGGFVLGGVRLLPTPKELSSQVTMAKEGA